MFGIKKGKSRIFDQMGHRQANTSWQKGKTKLHSVPRGKANDYERSFKERSEMLRKCRYVIYHHYFRCYLWLHVLMYTLFQKGGQLTMLLFAC